MDVTELNLEQLAELKRNYMDELVNEGTFAEVFDTDYDEPSYMDYANADALVPDTVIFEKYEGVDFVDDDFFCTSSVSD